MKSDALVTILLGLAALLLGVINAKNKKKKALSGSTVPRPERTTLQELLFPEERSEERLEEPRQESIEIQQTPAPMAEYGKENARELVQKEATGVTVLNDLNFDAKKAVLFSEVMKPKFDEFG
ncbi:MAG: hypothetical protein GX877_01185 [Bacteroidales bacterium]|nr:hypothetical protein [Bacteroidales bacterium]